MNIENRIYREATPLECKLYWEKVDQLEELKLKALHATGKGYSNMAAHLYALKEKTFKLLSNIGYKIDKAGLFVREGEDALNAPYDEALDTAVHVDMVCAMQAMRHGPQK